MILEISFLIAHFVLFNCSIHHNRKGIADPRTKDYVTIAQKFAMFVKLW